jgi:hypothetical protein
MKEKKYEIGGKIFIQRPLVLGQWKQIMELIAEMREADPLDIFAHPRCIAILLMEKGVSLKEKNLEASAEFIERNIDAMISLEVVNDFFDLSPVHLFSQKLMEVRGKIEQMRPGSIMPASSSQAEISPKGKKSSGGSPPKNAPLI